MSLPPLFAVGEGEVSRTALPVIPKEKEKVYFLLLGFIYISSLRYGYTAIAAMDSIIVITISIMFLYSRA
jgi:hypothetical protein